MGFGNNKKNVRNTATQIIKKSKHFSILKFPELKTVLRLADTGNFWVTLSYGISLRFLSYCNIKKSRQ